MVTLDPQLWKPSTWAVVVRGRTWSSKRQMRLASSRSTNKLSRCCARPRGSGGHAP